MQNIWCASSQECYKGFQKNLLRSGVKRSVWKQADISYRKCSYLRRWKQYALSLSSNLVLVLPARGSYQTRPSAVGFARIVFNNWPSICTTINSSPPLVGNGVTCRILLSIAFLLLHLRQVLIYLFSLLVWCDQSTLYGMVSYIMRSVGGQGVQVVNGIAQYVKRALVFIMERIPLLLFRSEHWRLIVRCLCRKIWN